LTRNKQRKYIMRKSYKIKYVDQYNMSSISILVIEKGGNIKELKVKSFDEAELYKKGGFKSATYFKQHTVWDQITLNNSKYNIHVYGKTVGRANQENKYEFPPPIDKTLFFGSCVLVNKINNIPHNLTSKEWKSIYSQLYGGFEELTADDSDESIDPDENLPKTKSGYMKDDFIVDDDFDDDDDADDEGSLSDTPQIIRKNKKATAVPPKTPGRAKAPTTFNISDTEEETVYTNDMELEEEEYL